MEEVTERFDENDRQNGPADGQMQEKSLTPRQQALEAGIIARKIEAGDVMGDGLGGNGEWQAQKPNKRIGGVNQAIFTIAQVVVADDSLEKEIPEADNKIGSGKDNAAAPKFLLHGANSNPGQPARATMGGPPESPIGLLRITTRKSALFVVLARTHIVAKPASHCFPAYSYLLPVSEANQEFGKKINLPLHKAGFSKKIGQHNQL
jgi:hypothetical protein